MKIHCYSCGRDTETSEVKQFSEKPILRCKNCLSLNFKAIEIPQLPAAEQPTQEEKSEVIA